MKGSLIKNAASGITVELPSGEKVPAGSVVQALDMVAKFRDPRTVEGPDVAFETEKHLYIAPEVASA